MEHIFLVKLYSTLRQFICVLNKIKELTVNTQLTESTMEVKFCSWQTVFHQINISVLPSFISNYNFKFLGITFFTCNGFSLKNVMNNVKTEVFTC